MSDKLNLPENAEEIANLNLDLGDTGLALATAEEEKVSLASNWKLVWWRYRKNKLAVICLFLLLIVVSIILFP